MDLTREQKIGAGLIAGAVVLGIVALQRKAERIIPCTRIANSAGGTLQEPCPTEGPVDVCTLDGDYAPWRQRLSTQLAAVVQLQSNMEDIGVLDLSFFDAMRQYKQTAGTLIGKSAPSWTTESDIAPFLSQLRIGCDLLNQGNSAVVRAGRPEYVVQEASETRAFAQTADPPNTLMGVVLVALALGGAYYVGKRLAA